MFTASELQYLLMKVDAAPSRDVQDARNKAFMILKITDEMAALDKPEKPKEGDE